MNKYAVFISTAFGILSFVTGAYYTYNPMAEAEHFSRLGDYAPLIPMFCGALGLFFCLIALDTEAPTCCNDTRHQKEE